MHDEGVNERLNNIRNAMRTGSEPRASSSAQQQGITIKGSRNVIHIGQSLDRPRIKGRSMHVAIDWKDAPKGARWWAVDASGQAHWFFGPDVAPFTDFWFSEPVPAPSFGFVGDWRLSLTERPQVM